jgi:hypothetical protein
VASWVTPALPRNNVSSRLCELRAKGMAQSRMEGGVNYWTLTDQGMGAVMVPDTDTDTDAEPDIAPADLAEQSPENQPLDGDISPDMVLDMTAVKSMDGVVLADRLNERLFRHVPADRLSG